MAEFSDQLRALLADRHSPEAAALFQTLLKYCHKRVCQSSAYSRGQLPIAVVEEICGDVLYQLMSGGLAQFRGESLPELIGFVRVITDRTTWRIVKRRDRERLALDEVGEEPWTSQLPRPDQLEVEVDSPLPVQDRDYLIELLAAGSKAELARRNGVSRAAVTQRVQRIRKRVAGLTPQQRMAHEAWLNRRARLAVEHEAATTTD